MQAIDVVCFIIRVIVGGSIPIIAIVFAGSSQMNRYIQVGFPSKYAFFVTPDKFIFSYFAVYKVVHITNSLIHRN